MISVTNNSTAQSRPWFVVLNIRGLKLAIRFFWVWLMFCSCFGAVGAFFDLLCCVVVFGRAVLSEEKKGVDRSSTVIAKEPEGTHSALVKSSFQFFGAILQISDFFLWFSTEKTFSAFFELESNIKLYFRCFSGIFTILRMGKFCA